MEIMHAPAGRQGSWEDHLHKISPENKLLLTRELRGLNGYDRAIGHRAIGVVYDPELEKYRNYVPSVITRRYDAFLYIDRTQAVHPLAIHKEHGDIPELYPWNY